MKTEMLPFIQGTKKTIEFVVGAGEVLGNYSLTWLFKIILAFLFFWKDRVLLYSQDLPGALSKSYIYTCETPYLSTAKRQTGVMIHPSPRSSLHWPLTLVFCSGLSLE